MKMTVAEIARICGASLDGDPSTLVSGVAIDSRKVRPGDLFVAVAGQFVDGNDHVGDASRNGAAAVLAERAHAGRVSLVVADPMVSLVTLGTWVRDEVDPIMVGITGSTGKTTTRDLARSVASQRFSTIANEGNFNNDIGVPLTLLRLRRETQVAICELGARGKGDIARLSQYVRPQLGVVTNVSSAHIEIFGSQEAIAEGKGELVECLPEGGTAILNADDPFVIGMAARSKAEMLTFGIEQPAWISASNITIDSLGRPTFRMRRGSSTTQVELRISGIHQVMNALAASAVGLALGCSIEECRDGLQSASTAPWRMEVVENNGVVIVNDSYNANPASVQAALSTCAQMAGSDGRFIAVLGYMAELGPIEEQEHVAIGRSAGEVANRLIVVGERASMIAAGAAGSKAEVVKVASVEDVLHAVGDLRSGDVVLVKGSRVARLEVAAKALSESVNAL
ncbi:MAG: UDP-N-acetylmuramoyl-tripeptide--D-alanyl-D-alanine ligase [Actinomycetota bacterium]|nr:UDP-N-acetylmuramoyl-tripeptide--D-alanyl-D-alanine ligase [Actinomycetota bacterium]